MKLAGLSSFSQARSWGGGCCQGEGDLGEGMRVFTQPTKLCVFVCVCKEKIRRVTNASLRSLIH